MKLSEKLGRVIDILEADGDEHNVTEVIFEGFKLALAVEASPVRVVKTRRENGGHGMSLDVQSVTIGHDMDGAIIPSLEGKRVRIVPEKEGR